MLESVIIDRDSGSVSPVLAGHEKCCPSHRFGPAVRDYYLIHFCISGKGRLRDRYGEHEITAGEFFIIRPGEVTVYTADDRTPWEYVWLGFVGERAEVFSSGRSVYRTPSGLDVRLYDKVMSGVSTPEIYTAFIYELIFRIFRSEEEDGSQDKLRRIHRYIRYNYMQHLSVGELARTFGFDRSYLFRIFKERYGVGIKEYITTVRMRNARSFLESGYTVSEVAAMVGYDDVFNFSKGFKRYFGAAPSSYRK